MRLRTEIEPLRLCGSISHATPLMFVGSCFSDNIGQRMRDRLFDTEINPFGPLYNPASIRSALRRITEGRRFETSSDLIYSPDSGLFHSPDLHSRFSSPDPQTVVDHANEALERALCFLERTTWLCLTLGTSWCYTDNTSGFIVANCHKFPASRFTRSMLPPEQSARLITDTAAAVRSLNPAIKVLLTVSPIRHLADGLHGNAVSKASLLLACDMAVESLSDVFYFPSYEIMNDDLRDYRFYAADMKHPSETAVDYIYEVFEKSFFDRGTIDLASKCLSATRRLAHRPITGAPVCPTNVHDIFQQLLSAHPVLERAINNFEL